MARVAKNPAIDPTLPKVPLKLGAETYYLCFDFGSFAIAEAKLRENGVNVNLLRALDLSNLDAGTVVPLLYAALVKYQPSISPESVVKMVTFKNLGAILDSLGNAYVQSLAEPEGDTKANPTEPQPE